jgi:hypothetical protein
VRACARARVWVRGWVGACTRIRLCARACALACVLVRVCARARVRPYVWMCGAWACVSVRECGWDAWLVMLSMSTTLWHFRIVSLPLNGRHRITTCRCTHGPRLAASSWIRTNAKAVLEEAYLDTVARPLLRRRSHRGKGGRGKGGATYRRQDAKGICRDLAFRPSVFF